MAESAGVAVEVVPVADAARSFSLQLFEAWVRHLAGTRLGVEMTNFGGDLEQ